MFSPFFKDCINRSKYIANYIQDVLTKSEFSLSRYRKYLRIRHAAKALGISDFLSAKCQRQRVPRRIHSGWYFKIHFQGERLPFVRERPRRFRGRFANVTRGRSLNLKLNWMGTAYDSHLQRIGWRQIKPRTCVQEFRARRIP